MMNRLRDVLVDGILLALPLGIAAFLAHRVVGALISVMAPVAHLLPRAAGTASRPWKWRQSGWRCWA